MRIWDPGWKKFGSGMEKSRIRDEHPGSATLRICKPFKEPRNRFQAWRAGTTPIFDVPARKASLAVGIDSWAP